MSVVLAEELKDDEKTTVSSEAIGLSKMIRKELLFALNRVGIDEYYLSSLNLSNRVQPWPMISGTYTGLAIFSSELGYTNMRYTLPLNEFQIFPLTEIPQPSNYDERILKLISKIPYYNAVGYLECEILETTYKPSIPFVKIIVKQLTYAYIDKSKKEITIVGYGVYKPGVWVANDFVCDINRYEMNDNNTALFGGEVTDEDCGYDNIQILYLEKMNATKEDTVKHLKGIEETIGKYTLADSSNINDTEINPHNVPYLWVKVIIKLITDINNINQTFYCKLSVIYEWKLTNNDIKQYTIASQTQYTPEWVPQKPYFNNAIEFDSYDESEIQIVSNNRRPVRSNYSRRSYVEIPKSEKTSKTTENEIGLNDKNYEIETPKSQPISQDDCLYARRVFDVRATFHESLELENYPFDTQDLHIDLDTRMSTYQCIMTPMVNSNNRTNVLSFDHYVSSSSEWKFVNPFVIFFNKKQEGFSAQFKAMKETRQSLVVDLKMARSYRLYIYRVFLVIALMEILCLAVFLFDPISETSDRLNYITTILLTTVAYSIVVASSLPTLSYLTILDKYILSSYLYVGVLMIQSMIVGIDWSARAHFNFSHEFIETVDIVFLYIYVIIFIIGHIVLIYDIRFKVIPYEQSKLLESDCSTLIDSSYQDIHTMELGDDQIDTTTTDTYEAMTFMHRMVNKSDEKNT